MSDDERAARGENRNFRQLQSEFGELERRLEEQLDFIETSILNHSQTLDTLTGSMANNDSCRSRGANVPLMPFHGNRNEDFSQYVKQFELICDANNYAEDKRAQILASYLRDKAFYVYDSLTPEQKKNYDELKKELSDRFQTTDYRRYAHQKFQERRQMANESVPDFGCDVHRLGLAALSTIEAEQRDALIREKFISGLLPQLRELIIYSNPKTFHEAMTLAERLEGLQAQKQDHSARNVMLLEGISDRLATLELHNSRTGPRNDEAVTYLVQNGPQRSGSSQFVQPAGNLNNFRPQFRPSGMVCFKCNQTGHIARNCPRTRDMNTVICRLCNRMGHFARNCQRRGGQRPMVRNVGQTPRFGQNQARVRFSPQVRQSERSMAVTVANEIAPDDEVEFQNWEPLVGAIWFSKETKVASPNPTDTRISQKTDRKEQVKRKKWMAPSVRALSIMTWIAFVLFATKTSAGRSSSYRSSEPMLCQAREGRALWKLPTSFNCPEGNHTVEKEVTPMKLSLFKRNYIQYKSDAWKCVIITEEVNTFSYFFGDENLKRQKKIAEPVTSEDCTTMKYYKSCRGQPMIFQGGIYRTNNKLNWKFPGGGINCCRWKKFRATNCCMYQAHVYKRHDSTEMESAAGDVTNCAYKQGHCVLGDGSFLLWEIQNKSFCNILPWKQVDGKRYGTSWLSDDSNLALTFTKALRTTDYHGQPLLLSDQGIAANPVIETVVHRKPRQLSLDELKGIKAVVGKGGIVSSAQLAASLQALEFRWEQNMKFAFTHALNNVCNFMRSVIELLKTQVLANPTMAVRSLTNQSDIFATSGGNVIEVFPCRQLHPNSYQFKPMNGSCSAQLPIQFKINNKTNHGYLDPTTNIIHRFSVPIDCNLVRQVPLQIRDKTYIYHSRCGEITPAHNIPALKVLQWNIEPVIDMKATIFHEIVIYSWSELQTHISLNDIVGGIYRQREVLRQIGILDDNENPEEAADSAVSRIMNKGFFGFLHGLTTNLLQVWTFMVCLYVTICALVLHCVPFTVMPLGLNLGNGLIAAKDKWRRWNRRRKKKKERAMVNPPAYSPDMAHLDTYIGTIAEEMAAGSSLEQLPHEIVEMQQTAKPMKRNAVSVEPKQPSASIPPLRSSYKHAEVQPFRISVLHPGKDKGATAIHGTSDIVVSACIETMRVEALLDTGSSLTIIPWRIARLLKNSINNEKIKAVSMTGHQLSTMGEVETIVRIGCADRQGKVVVTNDSPYDLIIGTDLMKQFGTIKINFKTKEIHMGSQRMKMTSSTNRVGVFLCQAAKVLPRATITVLGVCYGLSLHELQSNASSKSGGSGTSARRERSTPAANCDNEAMNNVESPDGPPDVGDVQAPTAVVLQEGQGVGLNHDDGSKSQPEIRNVDVMEPSGNVTASEVQERERKCCSSKTSNQPEGSIKTVSPLAKCRGTIIDAYFDAMEEPTIHDSDSLFSFKLPSASDEIRFRDHSFPGRCPASRFDGAANRRLMFMDQLIQQATRRISTIRPETDPRVLRKLIVESLRLLGNSSKLIRMQREYIYRGQDGKFREIRDRRILSSRSKPPTEVSRRGTQVVPPKRKFFFSNRYRSQHARTPPQQQPGISGRRREEVSRQRVGPSRDHATSRNPAPDSTHNQRGPTSSDRRSGQRQRNPYSPNSKKNKAYKRHYE